MGDETHAERHLLQASNLQSLPVFDRGDIIAGFQQRGGGARVEPGDTAAEQFHVQLIPVQIKQIQIGNLQLVAR